MSKEKDQQLVENQLQCHICGKGFNKIFNLRRHVLNLHHATSLPDSVTFDHCCGSFEQFKIELQSHEVETGTHYVVRDSEKEFTAPLQKPPESRTLRWYNGKPYIALGRYVLQCERGPDRRKYAKAQYAEKRRNMVMTDHDFVQRRYWTQPSKKLNCPVEIKVTRALFINDGHLEGLFASGKVSNGKYEKGMYVPAVDDTVNYSILHDKIKGYFSVTPVSELEERFLYCLPCETDHKFHNTGSLAKITASVDKRVRDKIKELYVEKHLNVPCIKKFINVYVNESFNQKDPLNKRFYPDNRTIRNIIWSIKLKSRWSKFDLVNVAKFARDWQQEGDKLYFRSATKPDDCVNGDEYVVNDFDDDDDMKCTWTNNKSTRNQLLLVYQSANMIHLYELYGNSGILIDATYKTCRYDLPLYFVAVKTNCGYQPVCMFVLQRETMESIAEALCYLKEWNPDVVPRFGLTDYAWEEILALENVWSEIKVFLCSFHREQAWNRWCTRSNLNGMQGKTLCTKFRAVAYARSEHEFEDAMKDLNGFDNYRGSSAEEYFERVWLKEKQRWCALYQPQELLYVSNNGIERINKELKSAYLKDFSRCSLSELLGVLMREFLPNRYKAYLQANVQMMSTHKLYATDLDPALHNRPRWVIERLVNSASKIDSKLSDKVVRAGSNRYLVPSSSSEQFYTIVIDGEKSSCTCTDFRLCRMPCKHCFLVGVKYPECHPFRILDQLLVNPVYRIDCIVTNCSSAWLECESVRQNLEFDKLQADRVSHNQVEIQTLEFGNCVDVESPVANQAIVQNETAESNDTVYNTDVNVSVDSSVNAIAQLTSKSRVDVKARKSRIDRCNAMLRSVQSLMWQVSEDYLEGFEAKLQDLMKELSSAVDQDSTLLATDGKLEKAKHNVVNRSEVAVKPSNHKLENLKSVSSQQIFIPDKAQNSCMSLSEDKASIKQVIVCDQSKLSKLSLGYKPKCKRIGSRADREREGRENELCKGIPRRMLRTPSPDCADFVEPKRRRKVGKAIGATCNVKMLGGRFKVSVAEAFRQCQAKQFLYDDVINCAQEMIKAQRAVEGLQDTVAGHGGWFNVQRNGIQILFNGSDHWVTIKTEHTSTVLLYDSLGYALTDDLKLQMAQLLGSGSDEITVYRMSVQKQECNDCGVLAIAFAWSLACNQDPEEQTFIKPREHLLNCLLANKFIDFPQTKASIARIPRTVEKFRIENITSNV